jgi:amino acid transporter
MEKDLERSPSSNGHGGKDILGEGHDYPVRSGFGGFVDSFKRNPNARMITEPVDAEGNPIPGESVAEPALAMKLKGRHLQMIAIGGSIGKRSAYEQHSTRIDEGQVLVCSLDQAQP